MEAVESRSTNRGVVRGLGIGINCDNDKYMARGRTIVFFLMVAIVSIALES